MPESTSAVPTFNRGSLILVAGLALYALCFAVLLLVGPGTILDWLSSLPPAGTAALMSLAAFPAGTATVGWVFGRRLRHRALQMSDVLDNMSQAVCVIDANSRLGYYNTRYVEMCKLPPERLWRGRPLRDLLEERRTVGAFQGDADEYIAGCLRRVNEGKRSQVILHRGERTFSVLERPMPGGGWVATQVDITERTKAEAERTALLEREQRRKIVEESIHAFRGQVERMLKTVTESAATMRATASALFASSHRTNERVEGAVQTSNDASSNVESAAYAADELSSSIGEISRQLTQTNDVVRTAADEAGATNTEIQGLATAAQKIGDVVKMIQDIAGQTNLLALNATIEAARAGEAGRGFAVVASEVKSLAVQTAKATEEIGGQISAVQQSSTQVVEAIRMLAERMQEITHHSSAVAASLQQQNSATSEISQNVAGAARGTKAIVSTLGEVVDAAIETRKSAQIVLATSESVENAAESLRSEVQNFLEKVAV